MKKSIIRLIPTILALILAIGCGRENEKAGAGITDTPIPTFTPTATATVTPTATATPTVKPTATPIPGGEEVFKNGEEKSYMEKCKTVLETKPEVSVYIAKEGVKYGRIKKYTYYSRTAERDTNVNVLLPVDYTESRKYPVLYLLHGFWDNEDWMTRSQVNLTYLLGNLQAAGVAKEMIIVMPYIYCSKDRAVCTAMDLENSLCYDNFINDLITDLMPFIESNFSVATGRDNTAITGFSMGGRESLFIGFSHPELFGYIGAVCPAPGLVKIPNSPMHPGQITKEQMSFAEDLPHLLLITGSKADNVVATSPKDYHNILTNNGVDHVWHELPDTAHDHTSVKPHLYNYLRMIFW